MKGDLRDVEVDGTIGVHRSLQEERRDMFIQD
jgi:hypothetical protein